MLLSREEKDLDLNDNRAPGCRNPMTGRDGKKLFQALIIFEASSLRLAQLPDIYALFHLLYGQGANHLHHDIGP